MALIAGLSAGIGLSHPRGPQPEQGESGPRLQVLHVQAHEVL